jgi:hypothetical protein
MDVIAHRRWLPLISPGDFVLILDTGSYYHSSFSLYNSRQAPAVFLYQSSGAGSSLCFELLCPGHTIETTLGMLGTVLQSPVTP